MKSWRLIAVTLGFLFFLVGCDNDIIVSQQRAAHVETAKNLLLWNTKNLVSHADLKKSEISQFFAPEFRVEANGKVNKADYNSYYNFLSNFRAHIKSINYILQDFIIDDSHVVIPLTANIQRDDDSKQRFDAILILEFNKDSKIILWREVYVEIK